MAGPKAEIIDLLQDIRALLYLQELRAQAQRPGVVLDAVQSEADAAIERARDRA